jgi:polygalacturonase
MMGRRVSGSFPLVLALVAVSCGGDPKPGPGAPPVAAGGQGGSGGRPAVSLPPAPIEPEVMGGSGGGGAGGSSPDAALLPDAAGTAADAPPDLAPPASGPLPWPEANAIVARVMAAMPAFPERTCTVTDAAYGARADGNTDNTEAFRKAIAACSEAGGGRVIVPRGTYVSGAIHLQDNVELRFEMGAVIQFSADASKFPTVLTRYEGIELMNRSPMIYAHGRKNIAVTGPGVLDASRTAAWNVGSDRARLEAWASSNTPVAQRVGARSRSSFVEPYACTNVLISGITLRGAQFWQLHPTLSTNVLIDGVTTTDSGASNNDGFDPESCDHVVLTNSTIKAHDDAIAVKSGRDADGRRINQPMQNLVIMNSSFASTWGLLTLGSELTGGIRNVYGFNLRTAPGDSVRYFLELKGNSQRGGFITDVHLHTLSSTRGISAAFMWADMQYMGQTGPYRPAYDRFTITNARIDGVPYVLDLRGMSASNPLGSVSLHDSAFSNVANTNRIQDVRSVTWQRVTINGTPAR